MSPDPLDPAVIAAWARKSRASQSLPAQIMDSAVLARVVTLAFAGTGPPTSDGGPAGGRRAAQPSTAAKAVKGPVHHATAP